MGRRVAAFAPGRVNLIGEHTDYNHGLSLAFAIALGVTVTAEPLPGHRMEVHALELSEHDSFDRREPGQRGGWRAFARGATAELARLGVRPPACRLELSATLPPSVGLASSAALSVALCLALTAVAGAAAPDRIELARLCSRIENDWAGARTGLLDQLASLHGREDHALRIDFRETALQPIPLELRRYRLAVLPSGAPRELARSGYNARREECAQACRALGVRSLREAREDDAHRLPEPLRRRVRHVLSENARVERMVAALEAGDLDEAGGLLDASHRSLRDDYEVSVPALERAREACRSAGALGARLMGGGFGGSVLALFPPGRELPANAIAVSPSGAARTLPGN